MMKVLIVEDDSEKLASIALVLARCGVDEASVSDVRSSQQARQWMRAHQCDLLLLDLNIPKRRDEEPTLGEGAHLLQEIAERDAYNKPHHVIGITANENAYRNSQAVFENALVPIIMHERSGELWKEKLAGRIRYIMEAGRPAPPRSDEYGYDVAIVTALDRPELSAVLNLPWGWSRLEHDDGDATFFVGHVPGPLGLKVIAASAPFMGMPAASVLASKVIHYFRPKYLLHCGITAGVRDKTDFGDVLIADPSWDWGSGKFALDGSQVEFFAAPYQILLRENVRSRVRRMALDDRLALVRQEWPAPKPSNSITVRLGPLASGASVLADGKTALAVQGQHRKVLGIDMETYGVMAAAEFCGSPRPSAVSLKSVCDFADGDKSDDFQDYAAFVSARCAQILIEEYLFS